MRVWFRGTCLQENRAQVAFGSGTNRDRSQCRYLPSKAKWCQSTMSSKINVESTLRLEMVKLCKVRWANRAGKESWTLVTTAPPDRQRGCDESSHHRGHCRGKSESKTHRTLREQFVAMDCVACTPYTCCYTAVQRQPRFTCGPLPRFLQCRVLSPVSVPKLDLRVGQRAYRYVPTRQENATWEGQGGEG